MNMQAPNPVPGHVPADRVFDFDIYADPRVTDEVQASYAAAIADAPDIFYTPRNGGHWMVKRIEGISEIVKNPEVFSVREMQIPRVPDPPFFIPLSLDPPENVPYRQILMPLFSPKAVRDMEPKIRQRAVEIIEGVLAKGECDFVRDVASVFPVSIFMELMGMSVDRLREFRAMADSFFTAHEPEALAEMGGRIMALLNGLIDDRIAHPGADVISHLLASDVDGRKITRDEVLAMCFVLFLGGMDTVTNVSGFTYQYLAGDPELQARLVAEPDKIPRFVDEGLRSFGVINTPRLCVKDFEAQGVTFKAGDMVLCLLSVAGRDDSANDDPSRFDIDRPQSSHLTFSTGPHLCVGHILARAEIRILTEEWFKRIPSFEAVPGVSHGFRIGTVTAIHSLPIRWPAQA